MSPLSEKNHVLVETAQAPDRPLRSWITDWSQFLTDTLPLVFLVVVLAAGTVMVVKRNGGLPRKTIAFGLGAALVYLLLTRVPEVAEWFRAELPLPG